VRGFWRGVNDAVFGRRHVASRPGPTHRAPQRCFLPCGMRPCEELRHVVEVHMNIQGLPAGGLPLPQAADDAGAQPTAGVQRPGPARLPGATPALLLPARAQHGGPGLRAAPAPRNARLPVAPTRQAAVCTAAPYGAGGSPGPTEPAGTTGHLPAEPGLETFGPAGPGLSRSESASGLQGAEGTQAAPPGPAGGCGVPDALLMQQQMQEQMREQMQQQMEMQLFTAKQAVQQKLVEAATSSMTSFGDAILRAVG
jgi:hypothetical protein